MSYSCEFLNHWQRSLTRFSSSLISIRGSNDPLFIPRVARPFIRQARPLVPFSRCSLFFRVFVNNCFDDYFYACVYVNPSTIARRKNITRAWTNDGPCHWPGNSSARKKQALTVSVPTQDSSLLVVPCRVSYHLPGTARSYLSWIIERKDTRVLLSVRALRLRLALRKLYEDRGLGNLGEQVGFTNFLKIKNFPETKEFLSKFRIFLFSFGNLEIYGIFEEFPSKFRRFDTIAISFCLLCLVWKI